jgi:hypothetical protein
LCAVCSLPAWVRTSLLCCRLSQARTKTYVVFCTTCVVSAFAVSDVELSASSYSISETAGVVTVDVTRSGDISSKGSVWFATADDTAISTMACTFHVVQLSFISLVVSTCMERIPLVVVTFHV